MSTLMPNLGTKTKEHKASVHKLIICKINIIFAKKVNLNNSQLVTDLESRY